MLIARAGEEIVCPRGTLCGHMVRDANDWIVEDDFAMHASATERYACSCCTRIVAAEEDGRWRVHLRRGWVQ